MFHPDNYKGDCSFLRRERVTILSYKGCEITHEKKYLTSSRSVFSVKSHLELINPFAFENKFKSSEVVKEIRTCWKYHESLSPEESKLWFDDFFFKMEGIDFLDQKDRYLSRNSYRIGQVGGYALYRHNEEGFQGKSFLNYKKEYHPKFYKGNFTLKRNGSYIEIHYKGLFVYSRRFTNDHYDLETNGYKGLFNIQFEVEFYQFAFENKFKVQDMIDDFRVILKNYEALNDKEMDDWFDILFGCNHILRKDILDRLDKKDYYLTRESKIGHFDDSSVREDISDHDIRYIVREHTSKFSPDNYKGDITMDKIDRTDQIANVRYKGDLIISSFLKKRIPLRSILKIDSNSLSEIKGELREFYKYNIHHESLFWLKHFDMLG